MASKSVCVGIESTLSEYLSHSKPDRIDGFVKFLLEDFHVHEIDTDGNILNLGKCFPVSQVRRAVEHKKRLKTGQRFLQNYQKDKIKLQYPSDLFTEFDTVRLSKLIERLSEVAKLDSAPEELPFTFVVCKESGDSKATRAGVHKWIRETLPFLESKTIDFKTCQSHQDLKEHIGSHLDLSNLSENINLIHVMPTPLCVRFLNSRTKNEDPADESDSESTITLDDMIKQLDRTDYEGFKPKSYTRFLHFNVMKINRETSEVVHMMCKSANRASFDFFSAGNKDKRGITVQKLCIRRCNIEQMLEAMTRGWLSDVYLSDFCYKNSKLSLGDLSGNHFKIVIRGVSDTENLPKLIETLKIHGFINYFGLQRFGTKIVGTHVIGASIIDQKYDLALRLILGDIDSAKRYSAFNRYFENIDKHRLGINSDQAQTFPNNNQWDHGSMKYRKATDYYLLDNDAHTALKYLPVRLFVEKSILKGILANLSPDKCLDRVPKNILSIYVHSTQSLIFNLALTERLNRYGLKVVPGDLVVTGDEDLSESCGSEDYDENNQQNAKRIRVLEVNTEEEAERYTIYQVVMPLPGDNITYPANMMDYYEKITVENFNIPLENFTTHKKVNYKNSRCIVTVGGSYRFIIVKPRDVSFEVIEKLENPFKVLIKPEIEEYEENLEKYESQRNLERIHQLGDQIKNKSAVILKCSLPKSSYITVALREILRDESIENNHG